MNINSRLVTFLFIVVVFLNDQVNAFLLQHHPPILQKRTEIPATRQSQWTLLLLQNHHDSRETGTESQCNSMDNNRRSTIQSVATIAISSGILSPITHAVSDVAHAATSSTDTGKRTISQKTAISASWTAVDGLNSLEGNQKFVSFDPSAYKAMINDSSRTPLFEQAILKRLKEAPGGPQRQVVLDLGTGPYAPFAVMAAKGGAGKVYAIEANPQAAALARKTVSKLGYDNVITVLDGFSTDITLPDNIKADFAVAEIVGSVASEEGAYATIVDAHKRLLKYPNDANSWIPNRIQTYAAPASYTLHNLFQPPAFDWNKLKEPVRFNCRDEGLQLLSDPILVEDISFADILKDQGNDGSGNALGPKDFTFTIDEKRVEANTITFNGEFKRAQLGGKGEIERMAQLTGSSFSGIALWPRLILDKDGSIDINSRSFPSGGHQKSHWQTVLPIMNEIPVPIKAGDEIQINVDFQVAGSEVLKPPSYKLEGEVICFEP